MPEKTIYYTNNIDKIPSLKDSELAEYEKQMIEIQNQSHQVEKVLSAIHNEQQKRKSNHGIVVMYITLAVCILTLLATVFDIKDWLQ